MKKIYILLPVHNRKEITKKFVLCLKAQTFQNYHLILIDDGSTDGTKEMVREYIESLTVLTGKGNWWWAGSLQQGYQWLRTNNISLSDLVLIINDDTEFETDFLERGYNLLDALSQTLLFAKGYDKETHQLVEDGYSLDWKHFRFDSTSNPDEINCLSTRGLFFRVSDFYKIGGFHPKLLPHYISDYEFTIRAHKKGMKLITHSSLYVLVDDKQTGYHQFESDSLFVFLKKYFSRKSSANPIHWTIFIAMTCPWPWKFANWCRIWYNTMRLICKHLFN